MDILPASNRHCSSIQIRDCTLVASTPLSLVWALLSSSCLHHIPPVRLLPKKRCLTSTLFWKWLCSVEEQSRQNALKLRFMDVLEIIIWNITEMVEIFKKDDWQCSNFYHCHKIIARKRFVIHAWQNMQQQHNRNLPCRCCLRSGFLWTVCMTMLCCKTYMMYCWHSEQCLLQDTVFILLSGWPPSSGWKSPKLLSQTHSLSEIGSVGLPMPSNASTRE